MMTGLAALSIIVNYSAVFLFNYLNLVGMVFDSIARLSLNLTYVDALILMLALLLFNKKARYLRSVSMSLKSFSG